MTDLERIPVRSPASVAVFRRILTHGPIGRVDIARATGLSQAMITKAVTPLMAAGFVEESEFTRTENGVGRPISPLAVVRNRTYLAGIKVTADRSYGVLTDLGADPLAQVEAGHANSGPDEVLRAMNQIARELRRRSPSGRLDGIGVAVSGDVDRAAGVVRDSPLLGWRSVPLRERLQALTGTPVTVENDVRALTLTENMFGAGRDAATLAVVTIGAGIGCGLFLNGRIVQGAHGVSGEIGHLPLAPGDLVCTCGRRGCVETVASTRAIVDRVRSAAGKAALTIDDVFDLARRGDPDAVAAFAAAGEMIGAALAALVNLVGPELVIIAGESVTEYDLYADRLRATFAEHAFGAAIDCDIVLTPHTFNDWARGAAVCVIEEMAGGSL
ncbi:sugar kinase [Micromonospora arborensis]|uniref:Sugar kinase n=1 Tax=Micromonospora arborensis TaxID=2116518 RepID=A0A318NAU0_9ACTN|nr:ROK family transcriptional regulator [Micromonospora arborensis]PYC64317.1 sugar kinase [Micromonospora arborensis]